ncbi:Sialic acid permease [Luteitalea pratensis]|uniref:Sialic acid permease n=1 Tax=Luteitalea pratensis TaxID=1855912 RepID=A0A143PFN6_LUTPR|nr:MFS transporter [Luteitalea pratensis]AMY07335.1 Sialic acid permease [Luteitalea pratensis]
MPKTTSWFGWWREAPVDARRALWAAALGWMLDAFDVMLYALVLTAVMGDLGLTKATAGLIGSVTLVAGAVGGVAFGLVADRHGRTKALMGSILMYSVFTALCGLSQTGLQLALFRIGLGLGMGGEWASGAALVAETWPDEHRGKALGLMQSAWAIGYALAAVVTSLVLPVWGWRAVFLVGVLPALFTVWIRRSVREPALWRESVQQTRRGSQVTVHPGSPGPDQGGPLGGPAPGVRGGVGAALAAVVADGRLGLTVALALMNACCLFAWWGFNSWIPAYLSLSPSQGGMGLDARAMAWLVVFMQVGMWFGYVTFGAVADVFGRRRTYVTYLLMAAMLLGLYAQVRSPLVLLLLGPFVAFFGTGYFTGFGIVTAESYPTAVRATAQGLTYNTGRLASAAAPFVVGSLADQRGFTAAFSVVALAFLVAAAWWIVIPETRGRSVRASAA